VALTRLVSSNLTLSANLPIIIKQFGDYQFICYQDGEEMSNPKIYLAGKMDYSGHDTNYESNWRAVLLGDNYNDIILTDKVDEYPIIKDALSSIDVAYSIGLTSNPKTMTFDYVGPYFIENCSGHGSYDLGAGIVAPHAGGDIWTEVPQLSRDAIKRADIVAAWIDSPDAYGTIFELGYAIGLQKHVVIFYLADSVPQEWWFVLSHCVTKEVRSKLQDGTPTAAELIMSLMRQRFWLYAKNNWEIITHGVEIGSDCSEIHKNNFLYVIKSGDSAYKVGISMDPKRRLSQLQTGNHNPLSLVMQIPFESSGEANRVERIIHEKIKAYNSSGEWFKIQSAILGAIILESLEYVSK